MLCTGLFCRHVHRASTTMLTKRIDVFLNGFVIALLCATAWFWSGLRIAYYPYFSAAALFLLLTLAWLWLKAFFRQQDTAPSRSGFDSIFFIGFVFLAYAGIQAWNAGRSLYLDEEKLEWVYTLPPHPNLPSAFNQGEATRLMSWFFVAWVLTLTIRFLIRHGNPSYWKRSLFAIILNADMLVCFGLYTFFVTPGHMFGVVRVNHNFFSTFPYTNHAAAFFTMIAALAAGLLITEILTRTAPSHTWHRLRLLFLSVSLFLCVVGANFSLSRAGIILAWGLTAITAIYMLRKTWRTLHPAARVNLSAASLAAVAIFYFFISGFGAEHIQNEFKVSKQPVMQLIPPLASINLDLTVRPALWRAGWEVFRANWLYGTGGWGFRYAAATHVPREEWDRVIVGAGRANVHNDPIQFLSEFGVIGNAFLLIGLGILIYPVCNRNAFQHPMIFMMGLGLFLVYIFGLIDLPYRCPAIMWAWIVLLAWLPGLQKGFLRETKLRKKHRYKANPWIQIPPPVT